VKKLCKDKDFEFMGLSSIVMPENYISRYDVPDQAESWEIIKRAEPNIQNVAKKIENEEPFQSEWHALTGWFLSSVVNPIFYSLIVKDKGFYSTEACISCGKCVKLCPINNVRLVNGRPKWDGYCTHCMACICGCPAESIEFKNKSKGKPRYFIAV
jgi:ferredoxin